MFINMSPRMTSGKGCGPSNGRGRRRGGGPGRSRSARWVGSLPRVSMFKPAGVRAADLQVINLTVEELETVRLSDLEGLDQSDAAMMMGISRKTFWTDLKSARRKIALALVEGHAIVIEGGNYIHRPYENEEGDE